MRPRPRHQRLDVRVAVLYAPRGCRAASPARRERLRCQQRAGGAGRRQRRVGRHVVPCTMVSIDAQEAGQRQRRVEGGGDLRQPFDDRDRGSAGVDSVLWMRGASPARATTKSVKVPHRRRCPVLLFHASCPCACVAVKRRSVAALLAHLAQRGARQGVDDEHVARGAESRQPPGEAGQQARAVDLLRAGAGTTKATTASPSAHRAGRRPRPRRPRWIRAAPLRLRRADVLAAADDHVLEPAVDLQPTVGVEVAGVARVEPAAAERTFGGRVVAPVAAHQLRAAHQHLAAAALRQCATFGVDDAQFGAERGAACRAGVRDRLVGVQAADDRAGFGGTPDLDQRHAARVHGVDQAPRHDGRSGGDQRRLRRSAVGQRGCASSTSSCAGTSTVTVMRSRSIVSKVVSASNLACSVTLQPQRSAGSVWMSGHRQEQRQRGQHAVVADQAFMSTAASALAASAARRQQRTLGVPVAPEVKHSSAGTPGRQVHRCLRRAAHGEVFQRSSRPAARRRERCTACRGGHLLAGAGGGKSASTPAPAARPRRSRAGARVAPGASSAA